MVKTKKKPVKSVKAPSRKSKEKIRSKINMNKWALGYFWLKFKGLFTNKRGKKQ